MKRVVIVDDDQDILQILTYIFQKQGFKAISFERGEPCLAWLTDEKSAPDLMILDWNLPDMNGGQLLEQMEKKIPVLMLSALSQEANILAAYQKGVSDYITKPFMISILLEKALRLI